MIVVKKSTPSIDIEDELTEIFPQFALNGARAWCFVFTAGSANVEIEVSKSTTSDAPLVVFSSLTQVVPMGDPFTLEFDGECCAVIRFRGKTSSGTSEGCSASFVGRT